MDSFLEDRIEVRTYFRRDGKLIGTEICDNESEARVFAKHQLSLFPYVEIVHVYGIMQPWGVFEVKRTDLIGIFE